jgi:hypothetical protein
MGGEKLGEQVFFPHVADAEPFISDPTSKRFPSK